MRLACLTIVVALLAAVGPTIAQGDHPNGWKIGTRGEPYTETMTVEDDVYANPGWWQGVVASDAAANAPTSEEALVDVAETILAGNASGAAGQAEENTSASTSENHVDWFRVYEDDAEDEALVDVLVETEGATLAAMDVFRVYESNVDSTPDCPQYLVEDLYPQADEDTFGHAFRVKRETVDYHQRAAAGAQMSVSLDVSEAEHGYLVAVYPQAGTGNDALGEAASPIVSSSSQISYEVSLDTGDAWVREEPTQPENPYETSRWTPPGDTQDCAGEGIALPPTLTSSSTPASLPGGGDTADGLTAMFDNSIQT